VSMHCAEAFACRWIPTAYYSIQMVTAWLAIIPRFTSMWEVYACWSSRDVRITTLPGAFLAYLHTYFPMDCARSASAIPSQRLIGAQPANRDTNYNQISHALPEIALPSIISRGPAKPVKLGSN
jgi:hypothetical protein